MGGFDVCEVEGVTAHSNPSEKPVVAVVYHFFAHYRAAVMRELLGSERYHYLAVGDVRDPDGSGIEPWKDCPPERFIHAPCTKLAGPVLLQRGLLRLALRRDLTAIIFLGAVHWPSTWIAAALARLTGKRVLFWTHGWIRRDPWMFAWIRSRFYRLAHALLLYGHRAREIGVEAGFPADALHVIYNSLDVDRQKRARNGITEDRIRSLRARLFPESTRPMIICTTRLTRVRRLDELLETMSRLEADGHPVNLLLVGDGPERETLEQMSRDLRLSVQFYGSCYDEEELAELVMAANATVAPGQVGLTAMHSLGFGTPVITHDDPDRQMPEWEAIVPGESGDFFRRGDIESLASVIRKWTHDELPDPEARLACHQIIDRYYNPKFQRRAIERALDGLAAEDSQPPHVRAARSGAVPMGND